MNPVYVQGWSGRRDAGGSPLISLVSWPNSWALRSNRSDIRLLISCLKGRKPASGMLRLLVLNPTRTADMAFTAAYLDVGNPYLVLANSPRQNSGDAERPGHRIAVTQGATQDLFLSKNLKQAKVILVPLIQTSGLELLTSGKAHALAGNTQVLVELAPKIPGATVVGGASSKSINEI